MLLIINILKVLMFTSALIFIYFLLNLVSIRLNRKVEEARCSDEINRKSIRYWEKMITQKEKNKSYYVKVEKKLKKLGNPLKLTPLRYMVIKFVMPIVFMIAGLRESNNPALIIVVSVIAFFSIDIVHQRNYRRTHKDIKKDLPDIYDILDIQTSAGVQIGSALTEIYDIPKCKRLRKDLLELAAEFNMRKNINKAIDNFLEKYDYTEINSFGLAIKQAQRTGKSKDMLENQANLLKGNNIFTVQEETKNIGKKILVIRLMLFLGAMLILAYAFITQTSGGMGYILK